MRLELANAARDPKSTMVLAHYKYESCRKCGLWLGANLGGAANAPVWKVFVAHCQLFVNAVAAGAVLAAAKQQPPPH